jgi:hypothetical protein
VWLAVVGPVMQDAEGCVGVCSMMQDAESRCECGLLLLAL